MVNNNILVYLFSIILIFKILIMQKSFFLFLVSFICNGMILLAQNNSGFHIIKTFHIASPGGWDYIAVSPGNNRLYVSQDLCVCPITIRLKTERRANRLLGNNPLGLITRYS